MNTLNNTYKKSDGDVLSASTWNGVIDKINETVGAINNGSSNTENGVVKVTADVSDKDKRYVSIDAVKFAELTDKGDKGINISLSGNNNINIEPRESLGTGEGKNNATDANRKGGNISLKPGDDIELCSHKRGTSKNTEVAIKVMDGNDNPVKLLIFAGDITLTTKDKDKTKKKDPVTGEDTAEALYNDPDVMNINITKNKGKGYLKVRAQAIDLRCEEHGGIALLPKGKDGQGNMNKIKFEHGGGDGLEFGTFNTERTSIFTDEYRFNKNGVIKIATRQKETSDKYDGSDETTQYKYIKQSDDFYDVISSSDPTCTWEDIVKYIHWAKTNKQGPWAA